MDKMLELQIVSILWMQDRTDAVKAWMRRDDGQEAGVEKLILIGAAIAIAVAAAAFFVTKFNAAKNNVDDPTKTVVNGG